MTNPSHSPRVSVVTSVYNHARFLPERFRSIRGQTFEDWEWILVDDASTDGGQKVARQLIAGDPRIHFLANDTNRGMTYTQNRGFEAARGKYIYRADSDDSCQPAFLSRMVAVLEAAPSASFAACRARYMNADGRIWGNPFPGPRPLQYTGQAALAKLVLRNFLNAPTIVYRRSAVEAVGGFAATTANISSDWYLNMRMCLVGGLVHIGDRLAYYRQHDSNISATGRKSPTAALIRREVFQPITDIYSRFAQHPLANAIPPIGDAYFAQAVMVSKVVLGHPNPSKCDRTREEIIALINEYVPGFDPQTHYRKTLGEWLTHVARWSARRLSRA